MNDQYQQYSAQEISRIYAQHLPLADLAEECLDCIFKTDKKIFNIYFSVWLDKKNTSRSNQPEWCRYAEEHGMTTIPDLPYSVWRRKDIVDFYSDSLHKRMLKDKQLNEHDIHTLIEYLLDYPQVVKSDLLYRTILNASFNSAVLKNNLPVFMPFFERGIMPHETEYDKFILNIQLETRPMQLNHLKREFPHYQAIFAKLAVKTRLDESLPEHHANVFKKIKL